MHQFLKKTLSQVRNIQSENLTPNCGLRCSKESKNVQNISVTQFEESICYYTNLILYMQYTVTCMYTHLHIEVIMNSA